MHVPEMEGYCGFSKHSCRQQLLLDSGPLCKHHASPRATQPAAATWADGSFMLFYTGHDQLCRAKLVYMLETSWMASISILPISFRSLYSSQLTHSQQFVFALGIIADGMGTIRYNEYNRGTWGKWQHLHRKCKWSRSGWGIGIEVLRSLFSGIQDSARLHGPSAIQGLAARA